MKFHLFTQCLVCSVCALFTPSALSAAGLPDLSGAYNVATLTPIQRPSAYGDNLYLSREAAQRFAQAAEQFRSADNAVSDPNRAAPPTGGDGSQGAAGNVGGYNAFWLDNGDSAFSVDGKFRTSILTMPANGRYPALTEQAKRAQVQRYRSYRKNTGTAWWLEQKGPGPYDNMEQRPLAERCLLGFGSVSGPPMLPVLYNNLKRIIQTEQHILILVEMVHDARVIRLNATHHPEHMRFWMGDSIGRWEGDTLVVDTTNFRSKSGLIGADENLHVVERFSKNADGSLNYSFVVNDSTVWQQPWGGDYPWPLTDEKMYEYACHEGNYALGNIMRGARLLEREERSEN